MAVPVIGRPKDKRYLGNDSPSMMEVHELYYETANCQIDEIIDEGHAVVFVPDTHEQARKEGYDNCAFCIGRSER